MESVPGFSRQQLYLVAYLDLLNQRDKIMRMDKLDPTKEQDQEIFNKLFNETYVTVKAFKETIRNAIENNFNKRINGQENSPCFQYLTDEKNYGKVNIKFDSIGDTVVIYIPIQDSNNLYHPELISQIFGALSIGFLIFLAAGIIFRGGIEIGNGIEIGPGVIRDSHLFNCLANSFMIEKTHATNSTNYFR